MLEYGKSGIYNNNRLPAEKKKIPGIGRYPMGPTTTTTATTTTTGVTVIEDKKEKEKEEKEEKKFLRAVGRTDGWTNQE